MCMCAHEYMHGVCGWMAALCSASGAATQPQPLSFIDLLGLLVATDNLPMPSSAVLI